MKTYLLFSFLLFPLIFCAQEEENRNIKHEKIRLFIDKYTDIDTNYIKKTRTQFLAGAKARNWKHSYIIEIDDNAVAHLSSDVTYNLSLTGGYRYLSLSYTMNINDILSGTSSKSEEWNVQMNGRRLGLESFFIDNNETTKIRELSITDSTARLDNAFNGFSLKAFGTDLYYYINHRRYSSSAAYSTSYDEKQIKSKGSVIVGLSFLMQRFFLDFKGLSAISGIEELSELDNEDIKTYYIGLVTGYGYNWVFRKNWLANATIIPSVGARLFRNRDSTGDADRFSLNNKFKITVVHNIERFYWTIGAHISSNWYFSEQYTMINSVGAVSSSLGRRF